MLNYFKGKFIHKENNKEHVAVETYTGMSVIGYTCNGCGYKWYEKRNKDRKLND
jgi:hypothetical protein